MIININNKFIIRFLIIFGMWCFLLNGINHVKAQSGLEPVLSESQRQVFASKEMEFIKAIYPKYLNSSALFENLLVHNPSSRDNIRIICDQAMMSFLDKKNSGLTISPNDRDFKILTQHVLPNFPTEPNWIISIPYYQCLFSANIARETFLTTPELRLLLDSFLSKEVQMARKIYRDSKACVSDTGRCYDGYTLEYFKDFQRTHAGNSQGEEAGWTGIFLLAVAKLIPSTYMTDTERIEYAQRAEELLRYVYSQCGAEKNYECPFRTGSWLVNNHQMSPNPSYTQSVLTVAAEIAAIYNQLGESLPSFFPPVSTLEQIGNALRNYTTDNFHFKEKFNIIRNDGSMVGNGGDYANNVYTINNINFPPAGDLNTLNQFYVTPSDIYTYITKGDRIWKYTCENGNCYANFNQTLTDQWKGILNQQVWLEPFPVSDLSAFNQYVKDEKIESYIIKNDKIWHYECVYNSQWICTAVFLTNLSSQWGNLGWIDPIPVDYIDAFSQYYQQTENYLKGTIIKGNKAWIYQCDWNLIIANKCEAVESKNLDTMWKGIGNLENWNIMPPIDNVDAFDQYFDKNNSLKNYIIKGDRIWMYSCSCAGRICNACSAVYTKSLMENWEVIEKQNNWQSGIMTQYSGVVDWGHDAVIQDEAHAIIALMSASYASRYTQLLNEKKIRGLSMHPYFPAYIGQGKWDFYGEMIFPYPKITDHQNIMLTDNLTTYDPVTGNPIYIAEPRILEKILGHSFFNSLDGYNSSIAYLLMTNKKIMSKFAVLYPTLTSTPTPACMSGSLGNLNCDALGKIDEIDLNILLGDWSPYGLIPTPKVGHYSSDLYIDGKVDESDYNILLKNWNP